MTTLQDQPALGNNGILPLLAGKRRVLDDAVQRLLRRAMENREHRPFPAKIHGVVLPVARGDITAIEIENQRQLLPVKGHGLLLGNGKAEHFGGSLAPHLLINTILHAGTSFAARCHVTVTLRCLRDLCKG